MLVSWHIHLRFCQSLLSQCRVFYARWLAVAPHLSIDVHILTLAPYSIMIPENCKCPALIPALCAVIPQHTCFEHNLHLHMHCHISWVSHTSDMNMTCYLHSIALKKAIVYVHSGPEKCLLPRSVIPTNALLSHFWSHSHTHSHSRWNVGIIPFS